MNNSRSKSTAQNALIRIQETLPDYALTIIIVIAFIINIADAFGLLDSVPLLENKLPAIDTLLAIGFIFAYQKTTAQVNHIDESIDKIDSSIKEIEQTLDIKLIEKNFDIFISAPITSFLPDNNTEENFNKKDEYTKFNRLCTTVYKTLQQEHPGFHIHYEGEYLTDFNSIINFKNDSRRRSKSFTHIDQCRHLIAIFPESKITSGSLLEIGYALARGVSCRIFYPNNAKSLSIPSLASESSGDKKEGLCKVHHYSIAKDEEQTAENILRQVRGFLQES